MRMMPMPWPLLEHVLRQLLDHVLYRACNERMTDTTASYVLQCVTILLEFHHN